ncbi:hypothetical protein M9434_006264 [Picochlorum sp. BPE23]|nr:hypothetical protein M9434_006264 [Picochlorum sp. BPE23]
METVIDVGIHLYWWLSISAASLAVLPIYGIDWFRNAVILSACRGKLTDKAPSQALGVLSDAFVPQKWFSHFYIVGSVWNAVVLLLLLQKTTPAYFSSLLCSCTLILFQVHVVRRFIETVYIMKYPKDARMHVLAYVFGLSYYIMVPMTYAYPLYAHQACRHSSVVREIMGVVICLLGQLVQSHSHYILSTLGKSKNTRRYVIPRGGLFQFVSCPHYFGEIVLYVGLALTGTEGTLSGWYPCVWVVLNLILAARMTHAWYKEHFKTYPATRKALIPFLY